MSASLFLISSSSLKRSMLPAISGRNLLSSRPPRSRTFCPRSIIHTFFLLFYSLPSSSQWPRFCVLRMSIDPPSSREARIEQTQQVGSKVNDRSIHLDLCVYVYVSVLLYRFLKSCPSGTNEGQWRPQYRCTICLCLLYEHMTALLRPYFSAKQVKVHIHTYINPYPDDAESFEVVHPWLGLGNTTGYYNLFLLFLGFSVKKINMKKKTEEENNEKITQRICTISPKCEKSENAAGLIQAHYCVKILKCITLNS